MKASHIMYTLKILTDLCFTKQRIKTKSTFGTVVYSVLVVKMYWQNIKNFVWALMAHNLQDLKKKQLNLKIILNKYKFHLNFMLISSVI